MTMVNESEIVRVLKQIQSSISTDINGLTQMFSKFLRVDQDYLITFMNNQFFRGDDNLILFLSKSIAEQNNKAQQQIRKNIYGFIADYIGTYKDYLRDYLKGLFEKFYMFFKQETSSRTKEKALYPIKQLLLNYSDTDLDGVLDPANLHNNLTTLLKIQSIKNLPSTVRGQIWMILGILQNKFRLQISYNKKKQVQIISFTQLKGLVDKDKNISTIACILRGFIYSLNQNYLQDKQLQQVFAYVKAILIPLKSTFDASIAALQLLSAQAALFQPYIMKNAGSLYQTLSGLMGHQNKQYKFTLLDTLAVVIKQIVNGISSDLQNEKNKQLFNIIGRSMWDMLETQTRYDPTKNQQKNRFTGNVISIVKILGILSPLILSINGMADLKRFFNKLLQICSHKVTKAFQQNDINPSLTKKIYAMKLILYNQKELVSFIGSFAKIIQQIDEITDYEALKLQKLFLIGVRQYPYFLQKYKAQLIEAMVQFLMGLSTKPHIFGSWCKKIICISLMESLDAKRFNINSDSDYYLMISKCSKMWNSILVHQIWSGIILKQVGKILFDSLQSLFLNLDISYKTNLQIQLQSQQQQRLKQQQVQLANIFFLADQNIQMSNIAQYQYVSSLSLIFNQMLSKIDKSLYNDRIYGFYEQIIYRLKIYPKSIPLMKVIRSLNAYLIRTNWFTDAYQHQNNKKANQLLSVIKNFFIFVCDNIFKYQQNYFYEALKMLMSMPLNVFISQDNELLKNNLPNIIMKSLQLGQQIISLAYETIICLDNLFRTNKHKSILYLSNCLPYLQKYINFDKNIQNTQNDMQQKQEVRSYLFLYQCQITRKQITTNVMKFLGSIGGIAHLMVQNSTKDYISWDYYCKLDLTVSLGGQSIDINLTKLLSRTCWLMLHGNQSQKIVSCQFMHSILIFVIGKAAAKGNTQIVQTKQNLSNFFDRVLPTLLNVGSNPSHPSQQLIHTLIIQTIHFLANTQDSNSPDIQTLLKHLIALYTGAQDMSLLASKCLSELVKWHIKQAPSIEGYNYPLIKTVIRNVWSLVSNKKARNGLLQFLIKFLKAIHRQSKLMTMYAIQLCSLIISLGRTDKQIQPLLDYLIKKYILAIGPYIKYLIIQDSTRRFRKLSTIQKLLLWIYSNALFSLHRQQRIIAFTLWESILGKYGHSFNSSMNQNQTHNIQIFLYEHVQKDKHYLFGQSKALAINEDEPKLQKVLPKITAYGQIWIKIVKKNIFQASKINKFRDLEQVYLESFCNFIDYLTQHFINLDANLRILSYQAQKSITDCILTFIQLFLSLKSNSQFVIKCLSNKIPFFQKRRNIKNITFIQILFKFLFKPNSIIPNFNYDLIYQASQNSQQNQIQIQKQSQANRKQLYQNYYYTTICSFLQNLLGNTLFPQLFKFIRNQFRKQSISQLIDYIIYEPTFYDRQIKCILNTLTILANSIGRDYQIFDTVLKDTLKIITQQYGERDRDRDLDEHDNKQISTQKKSLLVWYILQHTEIYAVIKDFLVAVIQRDTVIYQKHQKNIMKSIVTNWYGVNQKIVNLAKNNNKFLSLIFVLCKILPQQKKQNLYQLIQTYLIDIGIGQIKTNNNQKGMIEVNKNINKDKPIIISQMLKIVFFIFQDCKNTNKIYNEFEQYGYELIRQGMNTKLQIDIHEQALNLAGLIINQHEDQQYNQNYQNFIQKFRQCLQNITNLYAPVHFSKMETPQQRHKCSNYLKLLKSMIILSNDIKYIQFIFFLLKDIQLQGYYLELLEQFVDECLYYCYENASPQKQMKNLKWMSQLFLKQNQYDKSCWRNVRIVAVDFLLKKAIKVTKQDILIQFFQNQAQKLMNQCIKMPITMAIGSIQKLVLHMEIKRAAFSIIEELYSNLPRKQKNTEEIYKKQLHKPIIKYCSDFLKSKFNEQAQQMLKQYDQNTQKAQSEKIVVTKTQKLEGKKPTCMQYLRKLYCGAYNCLIVSFISTQSNKDHFKTYLFESKNLLWKNIMDENKINFDFQILTAFSDMKPITKINKKLNKKIKDKYWSNSLYAIQQQYVPTSLVQSLNVINEQNENRENQPQAQTQQQKSEGQKVLQLDLINKHPCMINLLRVIDYMHENFFDGNLPGWMKPIYDELSSDMCPLSVRILLTKLIINRPNIFTQNMWAQMLLKYLVLKENGGKFIHYFYRDVCKQFLIFIKNGFKPQNMSDVNSVLMKVIRALPHENNLIYSDNIDIMEQFLKIQGVIVNKTVIVNMLKSNEKAKQQVKLKFQWRMCATIVLKSCLFNAIPILQSNQSLPRNPDKYAKYKFYFDMRKDGLLKLIFEMSQQNVKKYRIAAAGFLGEYLLFLTEKQAEKLQLQQSIRLASKFISKMMQQTNRNSKQKFSISVLHVAKRFPQILNQPQLYNQIQTSLTINNKQQRNQIMEAILYYAQHLIKYKVLGYIPNIFVTIRSIITKILYDIHQVQTNLLLFLFQCGKQQILINKQVIDTYYYIYDDLDRVFSNSNDLNDVTLFYRILILLKDFTSDPDLPKTQQIRKLNMKVNKNLLKGLGSQHQSIRQLIFNVYERESKDYDDSVTRMLDIIEKLYDSQHEDLWLINVVPLMLSLVKNSSDYTRLRFQQALGDLTAFYDWDFRKNMKLYNNSQPYTPAFTLSTGTNNFFRRPDGTIQPSFNPSLGGQKLRGMLKASQNYYTSQQQQIFTILASQSDFQPSFDASLNSQRDSPMQYSGNSSLQNQQTKQSNNRINNIFTATRKKRNKNMQQFKQANMYKYPTAIKVVENKIRFNKNYDRNSNQGQYNASYNNKNALRIGGNKGVLIRKYKVGELPDIQITTKDIIDPMLFLANRDPQFASQLFVLVFIKLCFYSNKEKKDRFQEKICELLRKSIKYQYNFISTLEKSLILLCHNQQQKMDFSIKDIAMKSHTIDYGIIFTEENQIQTIKQPDFQNQRDWQQKVNNIWGDLVDLYQQISQQDLIYGVLIRLSQGDERKLLLQALNLKKVGSIKKSEQCFNAALNQSNSKRIRQFIIKQKIDCSTILGDWDTVTHQMENVMNHKHLTVNQQKTLTVAVLNKRQQLNAQLFKKITFHQTKTQYQKSILYILYDKDYDMAYHHIQKSLQYFSNQWKKISSFAFNSKHALIQQVQKKYELQQFLQLFRKDEIKQNDYEELFSKWSDREPNSIYDSNLTFLQVLQSRIMFSQLLSKKFDINEQILVRSKIDWLIQIANGMIDKGILGGAQTLIKKALIQKRKQKQFFWDFYDSIASLKLKQLLVQRNRQYTEYQRVGKLIKKQMDESKVPVTQVEKLKLISLKNKLIQCYLSSCLTFQDNINPRDFVQKTQSIFNNYEQLKRNIKQINGPPNKQFQLYRKQMYFKFTLFLQKMLTFTNQKTNYPQIRQLMIKKNHDAQRYAHIFVQMLFNSIQISDFTTDFQKLQQNTVFALIMKLIKIIQLYPGDVGEYFAESVSSKRIPIWIFLYFIPQMIKYINNPNLVTYFEDLFRIISNMYPQALIYHFNCSYEQEKQRLTPFCKELSRYLQQKMDVNYKFIESLGQLQYPQIKLRDSLSKFLNVACERQNAVLQLKQQMKNGDLLGKYNKKFVQDWTPKITRVINKIESNDLSVMNDIKTIISFIDPSRKQNFKTVCARMRDFAKVSDGSLFFEEYNSNDWNRIQIPGTSYRKFQQPKPWKKIYIESFDQSLFTLQSKQRPKRITLYGSDQKKYMLLIKSGEDVRLDQRIEELFQIMNRLLKGNSECSKKQLQLRRFQVTPVRKMMGIFQWVDESQTLKQFLQTELKIIKETDKVNLKQGNKAFEIRMQFLSKICPNPDVRDPNYNHKALLNANKIQVVRCFADCQKFIPYGLLRRALQRLSKNYDSFLHIKNNFIANYALICCVTYILGIGDRHLQNFLIHMSSASIVPIDFGFSFGASLQLGVPQLMPFRLTKCFQQLMDPVGFEGVFKKSMISSFEAFSENVALISDYCEVFVDDPLLQWIWTNKKAVSQNVSKSNTQFSSSQDPPQKALFTQKVSSVRRKLQGMNPRILYQNILSTSRHKHAFYVNSLIDAIWGRSKNRQKKLRIPDVVDELISLATDKNILGRTYIGWNPYV